jgi:hypothetical protein
MPTTISGTQRQTVITGNGIALERQYLFMPPESWAALKRLCESQQRSGSLIIQSLISIADLGNVKENTNGTNTSVRKQ